MLFDKFFFNLAFIKLDNIINGVYDVDGFEYHFFENVFKIIDNLDDFQQRKNEYLLGIEAEHKVDTLVLSDEDIRRVTTVLDSLIDYTKSLCTDLGFYNDNKLRIYFLGFHTPIYYVAGFKP